MKILPVSVLTSLALMVGAQSWAQSTPAAPAPLSKRDRIKLCESKRNVPLDPAEPQPVRFDGSSGSMTRPTILHQVPPRSVGSQGKVIVEAVIDEDGCVRQPKVVQTAGRDLDAEAVHSLEQWVFLPAIRDGHPVRVFYVLTVNNH